MMYGNSSMGYSYSPDRRNDKVDHSNLHSQFLKANGSRQGGYYYSPLPNLFLLAGMMEQEDTMKNNFKKSIDKLNPLWYNRIKERARSPREKRR